ncbi:hypothetical protein [Streptomyces sp. JHA26]|uniref:hypothetical protein n=1 Tax=Streptomyces sp. JHA26 TaxID=1917143 RepID=UPI0015C52266|nr:hypothetical protein [Streptomyces sp. JHA26]
MGPEAGDAVLVLASSLALGRDGGDALTAPYGQPLVERSSPGRIQVTRVEEVGGLARHIEGARRLWGGGVLLGGSVSGHEVGNGRADRAAADAVVAGEGGDGPAFQVRGAHVVGPVGRHDGATPALACLGLGGT